jgi:hypothetical protein
MRDMKPGYLLKIHTWENDADDRKVLEFPGLSENDCRFLIKVAQLFASRNAAGNDGYGNTEIGQPSRGSRKGGADLPDALEAVVAAHKAEGHMVPRHFDTDLWPSEASEGHVEFREDYTTETMGDFIGIWGPDNEYWRVFEKFEVFWVPEPIQNVTEQFK